MKIDIYQTLATALGITRFEAKCLVVKQLYAEPPDQEVAQGSVADRTWRQGFVHLTVDGDGLVSLWDEPMEVDSYLRLPLTTGQQELIEKVMKKGGHTP